MVSDPILLQAAQAAEQLSSELQRDPGNLEPAFEASFEAASVYQADTGDLRDVLPATKAVGLGFRKGAIPDGEAIFGAFFDALSEDLCNPEAELHKRIRNAVDVGAVTLIAWFLGTLGLGVHAAALVAPIAAAILVLGLDSLCRSFPQSEG